MANKTLLIIAAIIIIGAIFFISNPFSSSNISEEVLGEGGKNIGDVAFDLSFTDFEGKQDKFSNYKGNVVVVNAWAAWCPFCVDEMPFMQKISDRNEDVVVLFIHRTSTESKSKAQSFLNELKSDGNPITDPVFEDPSDKFFKNFFGIGMPVSLIIDKEGVIKERKIGAFTESELERKIQALL